MNGEIRNTTEFSLIDMLLEDQQTLRTPVGRFSEKHDKKLVPEGKEFYKDLIPLSKPAKGEQYAFQVDLDICTGCKACVTACHNLNGLDVKEAWRDAGKIIKEENEGLSIQQTVTTACHHCQDPACLNGCPSMAYEKDPLTGIVRHLDDQCIGCQYCVLKCPYDVPKFNKDLGIVRKCDMCYDRLSGYEAPACVQACPNEAIKIVNISVDAIELQSQKSFLPGAPAPDYTKPATQYKSKKDLPKELIAADQYKLEPQDTHWPLVFMLVITQSVIGFYSVAYLLNLLGLKNNSLFEISLINFAGIVTGIGFSTMHLGKPLKAWKAVLGFRTSWMSREVLAFAGMMKLGAILLALYLIPGIIIPVFVYNVLHFLLFLGGLAALFSSIKLYEDTKRVLWNFKYTALKFGTTALVLGSLIYFTYEQFMAAPNSPNSQVFIIVALAVLGMKYLKENAFLKHAKEAKFSEAKKSAMLIKRRLLPALKIRKYTLGIIFLTGMILIISNYFGSDQGITKILCLLIIGQSFASELSERYLFFRAVNAPKMPGEM